MLPQTFIVESLKVFVSCSNRKSSEALFETLAAAEAHEFGFEVVMGQRPCLGYHLSSRVDSNGMPRGFSLRVVSGKFLIAVCRLLGAFFFPLPSAILCLLERLIA